MWRLGAASHRRETQRDRAGAAVFVTPPLEKCDDSAGAPSQRWRAKPSGEPALELLAVVTLSLGHTTISGCAASCGRMPHLVPQSPPQRRGSVGGSPGREGGLYDAIVIGGGPAGIAAAQSLIAEDYSVILLEASITAALHSTLQ